MRVERFFEKFNALTGTPKAPRRLRELMLQMALQGRLSAPGPKDQRPEVSFPRLVLAAAELTGARPLPARWLYVPLAELGEWRGGGTPSSSRADFWTGRIPWVSPKDMKVLLVGDAQDHISEAAVKESSVRLVPPGSLLMVVRGMILARAFPVAMTTRDVTINQDMKALLPHEPEMRDFLLLTLRALERSVLAGVTHSTHGTCKLEMGFLANLLIPIPPLAEQKRIVAKVDELMALCDRLEAQQQERETRHVALASASLARFSEDPAPANLEFLFHRSYDIEPGELRKTVLTLAVQGCLTSQPSAPPRQTLGSILSEASSNGVSKGPTSDASATEVLRISAGTSRRDFFVDEADVKHVQLASDEVAKHRLHPGDLLACRYNGNLRNVGRFSYYRGNANRVQVNPDKLIRFRIDVSRHSPRYVCFAMNSEPTRAVIESMCITTAGNIGLSAARLKTVEIPLPPLVEQRRIVAKVDQLMDLIDELEARLIASRTDGEKLLDAVVAELSQATRAA